MTDHADTIRRYVTTRSTEGESIALAALDAELEKLWAERQQAIDERDALQQTLDGVRSLIVRRDEHLAAARKRITQLEERTSFIGKLYEANSTRYRAERQQAIDERDSWIADCATACQAKDEIANRCEQAIDALDGLLWVALRNGADENDPHVLKAKALLP